MKSVTFALMLIATLAINFMIIGHVSADRTFNLSRKNNAQSQTKQFEMDLPLPNSESVGSNPLTMLANPCPKSQALSNELREAASPKKLNLTNSKKKMLIQAWGKEQCTKLRAICKTKCDKKTKPVPYCVKERKRECRRRWTYSQRRVCYRRWVCKRWRGCKKKKYCYMIKYNYRWQKYGCHWGQKKCRGRMGWKTVNYSSSEKKACQEVCYAYRLGKCAPYYILHKDAYSSTIKGFIAKVITTTKKSIENGIKDFKDKSEEFVSKIHSDLGFEVPKNDPERYKNIENKQKDFLGEEMVSKMKKWLGNPLKPWKKNENWKKKLTIVEGLFSDKSKLMNTAGKIMEFFPSGENSIAETLINFVKRNDMNMAQQLEEKKKYIRTVIKDLSGREPENDDEKTSINNEVQVRFKEISEKFSEDWVTQLTKPVFTINQTLKAVLYNKLKTTEIYFKIVPIPIKLKMSNIGILAFTIIVHAFPALIAIFDTTKLIRLLIKRSLIRLSEQYKNEMQKMLFNNHVDEKLKEKVKDFSYK